MTKKAATPPPIAMPQPVLRKLADLSPVEYNPRTITERQQEELRTSMQEFGFLQPIIVNMHPGREGRIIGGEQRWRQAQQAGESEAPVIELDLQPDKERELNIRLNRVGGQWDWEKLRGEFDAMELLDWGFERYEFNDLPAEDLKLEGGGGGGEQAAVTAARPPAAAPVSPVRMVQLFFNEDGYREFLAIVERWKVTLGTETVTDTVLAVLRDYDEGEEGGGDERGRRAGGAEVGGPGAVVPAG